MGSPWMSSWTSRDVYSGGLSSGLPGTGLRGEYPTSVLSCLWEGKGNIGAWMSNEFQSQQLGLVTRHSLGIGE